jgi:hypothetical protein
MWIIEVYRIIIIDMINSYRIIHIIDSNWIYIIIDSK